MNLLKRGLAQSTLYTVISILIMLISSFTQSCQELERTNPADPNYELEPPTLLNIEAITDTSIELKWSNNEQFTEEFTVERQTR